MFYENRSRIASFWLLENYFAVWAFTMLKKWVNEERFLEGKGKDGCLVWFLL